KPCAIMFWPFKQSQRRPEKWYAPQLRFVGEQDGPAERVLKSELIPLLSAQPHVQRAYLTRVVFKDPQIVEVVLAIRSYNQPDEQLIRLLGKVFAKTSSSENHLDIMFITSEQEKEACAVCRPFYQVASIDDSDGP